MKQNNWNLTKYLYLRSSVTIQILCKVNTVGRQSYSVLLLYIEMYLLTKQVALNYSLMLYVYWQKKWQKLWVVKDSIRRFMKARLWVHFGRALRLVSTKILHPRRFQTTPGRFSKQSWGVRPWWRESPYWDYIRKK